jgi:hypothetical protein
VLRGRKFPPHRGFQPPHLGFAAFDHLFPSNQMEQRSHLDKDENAGNAAIYARSI